MKNKIIIHVGYPRTGSTALQYALKKKHKNLKLFSRNSDENIKEFYNFLYSLMNTKNYLNKKKELIQKFKKINFDKKINFISEEGILCQEYWYNSNDIYKNLKIFSKILKTLKIKYEFVIIIRNQKDLVKSIFNYFYISYFFKKKIYKLSKLYKDKKYKRIVNSFDYNKLYKFLKKEKINFRFFIYENSYFGELFKFLNLKKTGAIQRKNSSIISKYIENIKLKVKFSRSPEKKCLVFIYSIFLYLYVFLKEILIKILFYRRNNLDKKFIKKFYLRSNKELEKNVKLPIDYF